MFKTEPNRTANTPKLDGGGVYSQKKIKIDKGANQTENFIRVKTGNDIYCRSEKHY